MSERGPSPDDQLPPRPAAEADNDAQQASDVPSGKNTIVLQDSQGNRQQYQVKRTTKMSKVMNVFAEGLGREARTFRFYTPDGARIIESNTADTLELEDGDVIDVQEEQFGGQDGFEDDSESDQQHEDIPATPKVTEIGGEDQQKTEALELKVREHGGAELTFQVRPGTKMSKVMKAWCKAFGKAEGSVRFFTPDGKRIIPSDTVDSCDLVDGDLLDVQMDQTGGKA